MYQGCKKYIPFVPVSLPNRTWPNNRIEKAPTWCSVDLRDGNQALVTPMNLQEKLDFFKLLVDIGFKEIEVGFPSASETEYEILRALIDGHYIPDDVTIQVLVQAREHLIRKTFEAVRGAKNVIIHFYNSTSTLQRKVVFKKDMQGIIDIAVAGAKLVRELTEADQSGTNFRYEYSPESFSGTEMDFAVDICHQVMETLGATKENPVILNLPNTVEMCTPNTYADQIEYFIRHLPNRDAAIISVHPHNDRGTGVACAELSMLAGADRVEGTLFGNGERTGNLDIVTVALNMYTQGVDPMLDFSHIDHIREIYERCTKMHVPERWPYAGKLAFTAFSGSHQDAINKGHEYMRESKSPYWEIPYLPIDPADVGREYEPIIRINSQSGKGGAAFIMDHNYGYHMPKAMHPEFGAVVQAECDKTGRELTANEVYELFHREFLNISEPYALSRAKFYEEAIAGSAANVTHFSGVLSVRGQFIQLESRGNGPIDAFFNALGQAGIEGYSFISYSEHAISMGSDSQAVAYIELRVPGGRRIFGVGTEHNINFASVKGILSAINRFESGMA
ncbi:MAG: 2-isopropylmalate synthase [Christensenellales bacterium]|nr:2-isopropylmalate synthase [Clostridiales bacterium]MEE0159129.1 2-isopropylmalate synthase [Christensenellales bacterium]